MTSVSEMSSLMVGLQSSIDAVLKKAATAQSTATPQNVKEYEQDTRKSSVNVPAMATDIGVLVKDKSRLNVMSSLGKNDPVDFYKVKITSSGEVTLGRAGDEGVRFQLMDRTGTIIADSDPSQGAAYDAYKQMTEGKLAIDKGDYTVRVSRDKGVSVMTERNYAFQLQMGTYSEDYDTIARQPTTSAGTAGKSGLLALLNGDTSQVTSNNLTALLLGGSSSRGGLVNLLF